MFEKKVRSLAVLLLPLALAACGGGVGKNAASAALKSPELPTDKEAKCRVAANQSEPLIVEWPNAARGRLESLSRKGLVAVRYAGCELEILSRCSVKTKGYGYSPITRKHSTLTIKDEDDLYASMPLGALKLEGKLKSAGQLNVQMTIVGRYEADTSSVYRQDLEGDCSQATHVIHALTVGSFTFFAGADAEVGGSASALGAGGGGKSTAAKETIQRDGDEAACGLASAIDRAPPEGCGALLQIEVMPLTRGAKVAATPIPAPTPVPAVIPGPAPEPPPASPKAAPEVVAPKKAIRCKPSERLDNGVCIKRTAKGTAVRRTCPAGKHLVDGQCVDDEPPPPAQPPPPVQPPPPSDPPPETPPPEPACPTGTHKEEGSCVPDRAPPEERPPPMQLTKPEEREREGAPNPARQVLGYVAIASGITALIAGPVAMGAAKEASNLCNEATRTCSPEYDEKRSVATRYALVADVALGLTVVSLVTAFLLPAKVKVRAAPTNGGLTAGFSGSF